MVDEPEILWCHCNQCGRDTNHRVLAHEVINGMETDMGEPLYPFVDDYKMLKCLGCDSVCLRQAYSEDFPDSRPLVRWYPPPASRKLPLWRWRIPENIRDLLDEIYIAIHNDGRRLAIMGARALLDMLMAEKVGDIGSFASKLEALEKQGYIGRKNREVLTVALDAGHAAAHRAHKAEWSELSAVMDIVENVVQSVYHLDELAAELKKVTPARLKRNE